MPGVPNATYYYRSIFLPNCSGPVQTGNIQSFTTRPIILTTLPATSVTSLSATLHGSINSNGTAGCAGSEIGTTPNLNNPANGPGVNPPVGATFTVQNFSYALNPLLPVLTGNTYYCRIILLPNGQPNFLTGNVVSVTIPPVINNLSVSTTSTSATITFTTTVPASSQIVYGTNGLFTNSDAPSQQVTSHIHTLTNLTSGTVYNFYVSVFIGQSNQLVNSPPQAFTAQ